MLIFVYGSDTFRSREKVEELKAAFLKKFDPTSMNLSMFPGSGSGKLDPGEVGQSVMSMPFLGSRRMVVVKDLVSSLKKDKDDPWTVLFSKIPDTTVVILWETLGAKDLEKKGLFKKFKGTPDVHTYPFDPLTGPALQKWILKRCQDLGGSMAGDAVQTLAVQVGSDLWQMDAELGKLVAYAEGTLVTAAMVGLLVKANFTDQVFALMDAVSQRRKDQALKLLEEERLAGAADGYLLSMLARQVRILLGTRAVLDEQPRADKQAVADALGLHPFVASKALAQAKPFRREELEEIHGRIYALDMGTKTSRYSDRLAVDLAIVALLGE